MIIDEHASCGFYFKFLLTNTIIKLALNLITDQWVKIINYMVMKHIQLHVKRVKLWIRSRYFITFLGMETNHILNDVIKVSHPNPKHIIKNVDDFLVISKEVGEVSLEAHNNINAEIGFTYEIEQEKKWI